MENINSLIAMIISEILILILFAVIFFTQKKKNQLKNAFLSFLTFIFIWILGSVLQISLQNTTINPFSFEKLSVFGVALSPVAFFSLSIIFSKTKVKLTKKNLLFLLIPTLTIIFTLTNEYHHLMFEQYSNNMNIVKYGQYFTIHSLYTYGLYLLGVIYLII